MKKKNLLILAFIPLLLIINLVIKHTYYYILTKPSVPSYLDNYKFLGSKIETTNFKIELVTKERYFSNDKSHFPIYIKETGEVIIKNLNSYYKFNKNGVFLDSLKTSPKQYKIINNTLFSYLKSDSDLFSEYNTWIINGKTKMNKVTRIKTDSKDEFETVLDNYSKNGKIFRYNYNNVLLLKNDIWYQIFGYDNFNIDYRYEQKYPLYKEKLKEKSISEMLNEQKKFSLHLEYFEKKKFIKRDWNTEMAGFLPSFWEGTAYFNLIAEKDTLKFKCKLNLNKEEIYKKENYNLMNNDFNKKMVYYNESYRWINFYSQKKINFCFVGTPNYLELFIVTKK